MLRKLALIAVLLLSGSPAFCGPVFTTDSDYTTKSSHTVENVLPCPSDDTSCPGGWRMFLSSGAYNVLSATSTDGVNWGMEMGSTSGVRMSTTTLFGPSSISTMTIKGFAVYAGTWKTGAAQATWPYHAFFVVGSLASGSTTYAIYHATASYLGGQWGRDPYFSPIALSDNQVMNSPQVYWDPVGTRHTLYLYYTGSSSSSDTLADYMVYYSSSHCTTDAAGTPTYCAGFSSPSVLISTPAYSIAITTLTTVNSTTGKPVVRMYMTVPGNIKTTTGGSIDTVLSSTSPCKVITALSGTYPTSFSFETSSNYPLVVYSTNTSNAGSAFRDFAVTRSSEPFRWRLYINTAYGTTNYIYTAQTLSPLPTALSPSSVYRTDSSDSMTLTGEVFSTTGTVSVSFSNGSNTFYGTGIAVNSDISATFTISPSTDMALGNYTLTWTNADGRTATLSNALYVDYPPGKVTVLDNLFRPLKGGKAKFTVTVYNDGYLTMHAYTINGQLVKKIYDDPITYGTSEIYWTGDTSQGNTVASGLYFIAIKGPKIDTVEKVVVIK